LADINGQENCALQSSEHFIIDGDIHLRRLPDTPPSGDPNPHVQQAFVAGPGRFLQPQPFVGIFVDTGCINILLTYGNYFRKCSNMVAAGPNKKSNAYP
jgi:hypothetical protein